MMYRILLTTVKRSKGGDIYKYYMDEDSVYETEDAAELDRKVEELLETYNKNQINIVSPVDYVIDAIIDLTEIYVNKIVGNASGGGLTYTMSGSNLFDNEEYTWIMTYDDDTIEVVATGLTRRADSSEVVKYNQSSSVTARIKKDGYVSEIFTIK